MDGIVEYYNERRPHRARGRITPAAAFAVRDKAVPGMERLDPHYRIRHDKVDGDGKVSLRFGNKMLHLGVGRPWRGTRVRLYIAGDNVRVVSEDGELIAETTLDLTKGYQQMRNPGELGSRGFAVSGMSRDITQSLGYRQNSVDLD